MIAGLTAAIPLHSNLGAVPRVADSLKRDRFFLLPISHAPGQVGRHGQLIGLMDGQWLDFDGTQIVHRVSRVRAEWEVKIQRAAADLAPLPNPWMD